MRVEIASGPDWHPGFSMVRRNTAHSKMPYEPPYFKDAHLKIERANKHIADIDKRLLASSDTNGPSMHIYTKTGEQFIYYGQSDNTLRSDIGLMVGDAIHNLKCALDIAYRETIRSLSPDGYSASRTKFIVGDNRKHLESSLTKTAKVSANSPLFNFLVEHVKSYKGGDSDICAIHELDIDDKHHLLIPILTVVGIDGVELENEDGTIDHFTIAITRPNVYRARVSFGSKFKNHGKVRFQVTFREGTPTHNLEVVPTLLRFSKKTLQIVRTLQRMK
jgi:hypothetical protein